MQVQLSPLLFLGWRVTAAQGPVRPLLPERPEPVPPLPAGPILIAASLASFPWCPVRSRPDRDPSLHRGPCCALLGAPAPSSVCGARPAPAVLMGTRCLVVTIRCCDLCSGRKSWPPKGVVVFQKKWEGGVQAAVQGKGARVRLPVGCGLACGTHVTPLFCRACPGLALAAWVPGSPPG